MAQPAFAFRTLSYELRKSTADLVSIGWVTTGLGMQAKNIRDSGLFFIRNIYSLFDSDGHWRPGAKGGQARC